MDNLTKSLAIEWAEKGVRINSVAPVCISDMTCFVFICSSLFILVPREGFAS